VALRRLEFRGKNEKGGLTALAEWEHIASMAIAP
jgi:hypothetical protein